jgi:hypothetical protein
MQSGLNAAVDLELVVDRVQIVADGPFRQAQLPGDGLVVLTLGHQAQHLHLFGGQVLVFFPSRHGLGGLAKFFQQAGGHLGVDQLLDLPDTKKAQSPPRALRRWRICNRRDRRLPDLPLSAKTGYRLADSWPSSTPCLRLFNRRCTLNVDTWRERGTIEPVGR